MFVAQQISAEFLTKDLLQQLGSAIWIGMERIRNQRDQPLDLLSVAAKVYDSTNTLVAGPLTLDVEPDDTQPILQQAGYLLQTGPGQAIAKADIFRVVYNLKCRTGESALFQQPFVIRAQPFGDIPCPPYCPDDIACDITVTPTSISVPAGGGTYTFDVAALNNAGYSWEVSDGWIQIVSAVTSGSGQAVVNISANTACVDRTGQILVCGVTLDISQESAVTGCCDVTVSPASISMNFGSPPSNPIVLSITLINPTIPSAFTDVSWLHVGVYIPINSTQGKFEVTWDDPPSCVARTGHVFICDETVTIIQPFSVIFTPPTAIIGGNNQFVTTVLSGDNFVGTSFHLTVTSLSGRTIASGAYISTFPNYISSDLVVFTNGANSFYQSGTLTPPASCPVGETITITVNACDGTPFVITQVPKAQAYRFQGTFHAAIVAGPSPVTFGPFNSAISVPFFDPNYPDPSSASWELPFGGNAVPVTSWTVTTAGGNSSTYAGSDPGPYLLSSPQLAELIAKMHQGTCITHTAWSADVTIIGLEGVGPGYVIPSPLGAASVVTVP